MTTRQSVLITGANGFIGSRLCLTFLKEGFQVIAAVRKGCNLALLKDVPVEFRYGDVADASTVPDVSDVDFIVHNAGIVKARSREQFFAVNGQGTANLMAAIARNNPRVRRTVYVSSQAVTGPSRNGRAIEESDRPEPVTTYAESKLAGEEAVRAYSGAFPVTIVRPAGVYGPGDKEVFSFFQVTSYHLKPYFGDIRRKLQLVHVDDLCRGIYLATVTPTQSGSVYNIAENRAYTLAQFIDMMQRAVNTWTMPLRIPAGVFRLIAGISEFSFRLVGAAPMLTRDKCNELLGSWELSTEKARQELRYDSAIPFPQGAKETFDWYKEHGWL